MLTTPRRRKINQVTKYCKKPRNQADPSVRPKQLKRDMRFGTWSVRSLYRPESIMTVVRELARCKLDLVGVQEVRWDKGGTAKGEDYTFHYGKGNKNHQLRTGFLYPTEYYQQLRKWNFLVTGYHI